MLAVQRLHALGDPTRIEIVRRLAMGADYTITTVSQGLEMSRQAVRKHLQILADAHIVTLQPKGRDTTIELERRALEETKVFIAELELQWDKRLEALRDFVDSE
jgi:DNA-binding transcriptional ArsR family regulator